jgi:hypothetical protein
VKRKMSNARSDDPADFAGAIGAGGGFAADCAGPNGSNGFPTGGGPKGLNGSDFGPKAGSVAGGGAAVKSGSCRGGGAAGGEPNMSKSEAGAEADGAGGGGGFGLELNGRAKSKLMSAARVTGAEDSGVFGCGGAEKAKSTGRGVAPGADGGEMGEGKAVCDWEMGPSRGACAKGNPWCELDWCAERLGVGAAPNC